MKIFINATGPDQVSGYFTYITNLILNIADIDKTNYYIIYSNGNIYKSIRNSKNNFQIVLVSDLHRINIVRFFWMQFVLPFILLSKRIELLCSPLNATPFVIKYLPIKSILVIHSNLPWINPKLLPYGNIKSSLIIPPSLVSSKMNLIDSMMKS